MTTSRMEVVALHCDQGMGSLIRFYDTLNKLTNLVLVDLGSENGTKRYADRAVKSVMDSLVRMESDGLTPRIDALIVSHQDFDHWSLLPDLLEKIKSELSDAEVGAIYYGGTRWGPKPAEQLKEWEKYFHCSRDPMTRARTDYATPGKKEKLFDTAGATFRVLASNVPCTRNAVDLERNGTSAVIVVEFGGKHVILPGDATADTVAFINDNVYTPWSSKGKGNPTSPCEVLQAPHHGALRTLASNFTTKKPKLDVAKAFGAFVATNYVVASAGWYSHFNHPFESIMELLAVKASTDAGEHSYVVFRDTTGKWLQVDDSERGIYTTVKTLEDPPKRVGWVFSINATGEVEFRLDWEGAILDAPPPEAPPPNVHFAIPFASRSMNGAA